MGDGALRLLFAGDVMLGRGIDQIQAHPGEAEISESWAHTALSYVELAERHSGPIPRRVPPSYVWGELLDTIRASTPDALIVNLETAVTDRGRPWPGKGIQYRMHPENIDVLTTAGVSVANLANNHVLDWSAPGLLQTLETLHTAGIDVVGAGRDSALAWQPVRLDRPAGGLVVLGVGTAGSGIPTEWAASIDDPGVALITDFSDRSVEQVRLAIERAASPGDIVAVSIHWGGNWGYGVSTARRRFARRLIDRAGVHVIHGHSSHHPTGIEVHRGHLILYGCGDLITDYEGISGHEGFRPELGGLYLATLSPTGQLADLRIVPSRVQRFQLTHPSDADRHWLADHLNAACKAFGTRMAVDADGHLELAW